ncbi:MAG TPA: type II toxin-antitoxin system RelE/ParE family toxin [Planctomycetota bacterium]|nr:type II toxin-antitoxin system RelE/ParE family toxin [Planctomycetota bacterium]
MRLVVADAAAVDMAEAAAWYQHREPGLGETFLAATDALLEHIVEHPRRFRIAYAALRRALVPRFPYCVFYRVESELVLVVAVMHGRRNPTAWQQRRS